MLRVGNKPAAALTLLGDMAKGIIPILVARKLGAPDSIAILCGFCAFLGHLFPVYFGFHGGKGVATALGMLAALHWPTMLIIAGIWLLIARTTRISSLAAIVSFFLAPWIVLLTKADLFYPCLALSLILLYRHHHNLAQLIKGKETRL